MSRTYGETRNCSGCRFWSEMLAQAGGGLPAGVHAMCLAPRGVDAPLAGEYTRETQTCRSWKSGEFGAVDDPENRASNPYEKPA
jgi:hypothetical protein